MKFQQTNIPDVVIVRPQVKKCEDDIVIENFDKEIFNSELKHLGLKVPVEFVQDRHIVSNKGRVLGLNYQLSPKDQAKLVTVTRGSMYYVAVDLRKESPTFGQWVVAMLSGTNHQMLWIPEGFASGSMTLEEDTYLIQKFTCLNDPTLTRTIKWDDPKLDISWPKEGNVISQSEKCPDRLKVSQYEEGEQWKPEIIELSIMGDRRGRLISIEQMKTIPFKIKRVYYIYATKTDVIRGLHAHKQLEQLAVCVSGSCRMLLDDGNQKTEVLLDKPDRGLLIKSMIWHEMSEFSTDCVLMVLADEYYDESDYIRDYSTFLELAGDKTN